MQTLNKILHNSTHNQPREWPHLPTTEGHYKENELKNHKVVLKMVESGGFTCNHLGLMDGETVP